VGQTGDWNLPAGIDIGGGRADSWAVWQDTDGWWRWSACMKNGWLSGYARDKATAEIRAQRAVRGLSVEYERGPS
jgi:hypothetical protein